MTQSNKKQKYVDRNSSPEQRVIQHCKVIDASAAFLADRIGYALADLFQVSPDAKQAITGVSSAEGLAELIVRRIDAIRFGEAGADDKTSLERIARDAIRQHPLNKPTSHDNNNNDRG